MDTHYKNLKNVTINHISDYRNVSKSTPCYVLDLDGALVYYSYNTIVAVRIHGKLYISENVWSVTTGKHLNYIDPDKSIRMPHNEFVDFLNKIKLKVSYQDD